MTVRIETSGIARGRDFTLYARGSVAPLVNIYSYNPITNTYDIIKSTIVSNGENHNFNCVAPFYDGYLYAKINGHRMIKKVGSPFRKFNLAYKPNYTIPYKSFDKNDIEIYSGDMEHIIDGFYVAPLPDEVVRLRVLNKDFLINKEAQKMNYDVTIGTANLSSTFENVALQDFVLPNFELSHAPLGAVTLEAKMPDVTIKEI